MKNYSYILFDLDGTLTDSGPGIINSFELTLKRLGITVEDKDQLRKFVGPPLEESFGKTLGLSPDETNRAIEIYREYYFDKGVYDNTVYPGIPELLQSLSEQGKKLAIATSKGIEGTNIVLKHFALDKYFDVVATADHENRKTKIDVMKYAIDQCKISDLSEVVMIGDRHYDINAAKSLGADSIGVLYGYGDRNELEKAGATFIATCPQDILSAISNSII